MMSAAVALDSLAAWIRFIRWSATHPTPTGNSLINRVNLYQRVIEGERLNDEPMLYLEFGVYRGDSLNWWVNKITNPTSRFVGFDTFTGLPENWRLLNDAGTFDTQGRLPNIADRRCSFQVGLFQETLPQFLVALEGRPRLVVHLDADLFTSTMFVLAMLAPMMRDGDLLFFDEFSCPLDEFTAFQNVARSFQLKYEVLGAVQGYGRVCMKIVNTRLASLMTTGSLLQSGHNNHVMK
jgi:O-methyltransferase